MQSDLDCLDGRGANIEAKQSAVASPVQVVVPQVRGACAGAQQPPLGERNRIYAVQILSAGVFLRGMGRKFPLRDRLLSYDSVQLAETRLDQGHQRIHQVLGVFALGT